MHLMNLNYAWGLKRITLGVWSKKFGETITSGEMVRALKFMQYEGCLWIL